MKFPIRFNLFVCRIFLIACACAGIAFVSFAQPLLAATDDDTLQDQLDSNTAEITQLNQQIAEYQAEIQQAGSDKKTLQSAIDSLDLQRSKVETQISLIEKQIDSTKLQISQLDTSITDAQNDVAAGQASLSEDIRAIAASDDETLVMQVLSADSLGDAWDDSITDSEVQDALRTKVDALLAQEQTLNTARSASEQKQATLATQQQSLATQQQSLDQTKASKDQLLAETDAKESNYEQLLAAAQAQLASFSTFTESAGGDGLLKNQTSCDDWGCYYNQRDSAWGNDALDGTQYRLASDGCLVTAMAMVMTHYGYRDVTPATINADPGNFAAYYPAYLLTTIHVDGVTAARTTAKIDATLAGGDPVIVGLNAYGGTHFVVLVSGSDGDYLMRDPYIANGKDISFSAHYSMSDIYEINKVTITG